MATSTRTELTLIINNLSPQGQPLQVSEITTTPFVSAVFPLKANGTIDYDAFPGPPDTRLEVSSHDDLHYTQLIKQMPGLKKLTILQQLTCPAQMEATTTLLTGWADSLESLSLWFGFHYIVGQTLTKRTDCDHLLACLNSLPALRHLTFFFPGNILYRVTTFDLPILAQLESFNFYSADPADFLTEQLRAYALPNRRLHQLAIGNTQCVGYYVIPEVPFRDDPTFLDRLLTGTVCYDWCVMEIIPKRFLHLTALCFELSRSLTDLTALHRLTKLTHLSLYINFFNVRPFYTVDRIPEDRLPRLPSVRVLTIMFHSHGCGVFASKRLPLIFPNLQLVLLKIGFRCCAYCGHYYELTEADMVGCTANMIEDWQTSFPQINVQLDWQFRGR